MDVATGARWSPPQPYPRAIPGVVDVWRAGLGTAANGLEELGDLLCAEERARASCILDERRRALWARSRGVLRALLGRYLDADPRELRFELGAHGKPALALRGEARQVANLCFNLSHSGELMLVAVSAGREVGVDVERTRERHTVEFLRTWTMREAAVKCLGTGLGSAPITGEGSPGAVLCTAELDVGPQTTASLAVEGEQACELRCWDWPVELRRDGRGVASDSGSAVHERQLVGHLTQARGGGVTL